MPKSRIGGKKPSMGGVQNEVSPRGRSARTGLTRPVEKLAEDQRLDPHDIPLPEVHEGFSEKPSGLHGVIEAGLNRLAAAEGFQAQDNALGVMVRAMAGGSAGGPTVDVPMLQRELRQALPATAATASGAERRKDAAQLLTLATAALGVEGLPQGRAKVEAQLTEDLMVIKEALADVLKGSDSAAVQRLQRTEAGLSWAADVLSRGRPALDKIDNNATIRMDALAGVLRIVLKYAQSGA